MTLFIANILLCKSEPNIPSTIYCVKCSINCYLSFLMYMYIMIQQIDTKYKTRHCKKNNILNINHQTLVKYEFQKQMEYIK